MSAYLKNNFGRQQGTQGLRAKSLPLIRQSLVDQGKALLASKPPIANIDISSDYQSNVALLWACALWAYAQDTPILSIGWYEWSYLLVAIEDELKKISGPVGQLTPTTSRWQATTTDDRAPTITLLSSASLWDGIKDGIKDEIENDSNTTTSEDETGQEKIKEKIKEKMKRWHELFQQIENEKIKKWKWWPRLLGFLYALTQAFAGFCALLFFGLPFSIPALVLVSALATLSFLVNYDIGTMLIRSAMARLRSLGNSLWYAPRSIDGKIQGVRRYTPTLLVAAFLVFSSAVTMALLNYHSINQVVMGSTHHSFVLHFFQSTIGSAIPAIAIAVAVTVGITEGFIFLNAMIDILRNGGVRGIYRLFSSAYDKIMNANEAGKSQNRGVKGLAIFFFVIAVLANVVGISYLVGGGVSGLHQLAPMIDQSMLWACSVASGLGMAFFFIKSSVGWSYDASKAVMSLKPEYMNMTRVKNWLIRNIFIILGLIGLIACVATPGAGLIMGLAALSCSAVASRGYNKLEKIKNIGTITADSQKSSGVVANEDSVDVSGTPVFNTPVQSDSVGNAASLGSLLGAEAPLLSWLAAGTMAQSSNANTHNSTIGGDYQPTKGVAEDALNKYNKSLF